MAVGDTGTDLHVMLEEEGDEGLVGPGQGGVAALVGQEDVGGQQECSDRLPQPALDLLLAGQ